MNNFLLLSVLCVLSLFGGAQKNAAKDRKGRITIYGKLINIKNPPPYIYISCADCGKDGTDSAQVVQNQYKFIINTRYSAFISLFAKNQSEPDWSADKNVFTLLLEPGTASIVSVDSFSNAIVSGSKTYGQYVRLIDSSKSLRKYLSPLFDRRSQMVANNDSVGVRRVQESIDSISGLINKINLHYAEVNPAAYVAPYALDWYVHSLSAEDILLASPYYKKLSFYNKQTAAGKEIKLRLAAAAIGVGSKAPMFTEKDTSGLPVSLSSFKGKYILLDFWASWCGPCREENPYMVQAFKKYGDKNIEFISVSLDRQRDKEKWLNAIYKDGLTWTNLSNLQGFDGIAARLYKIKSIPQNFLIDPEGKIIGKGLKKNALQKRLEEFLD